VNGADALRRAGLEFGQRLELVTAHDWVRATPCDDWTVYDLVNHVVVGGNVRYTMILRGEPASRVLATHGVDALGSEPVAAFGSGMRQVTRGVRLAGSADTNGSSP